MTTGASPRHAHLSPITLRILAVNVLALAILVGGLLYSGEYRQKLVATELSALGTRAEVFAAALGEGAVRGTSAENAGMSPTVARQMMRRLSEATGTRIRLFDESGNLLVDTRLLRGPGGLIQIEELPLLEPPQITWFERLLRLYDRTVSWAAGKDEWPPYKENPIQHADDYEEVLDALAGDEARLVRSGDEGLPILSVAVPVRRYKQVVGAVMLTNESWDLERALVDVRLDILKVFGVALSVTVLLSLYLARTIARPLRRLALAAERVERSHKRQYTIPDFPGRRDEIGRLARSLNDMTEALWRRMDAIEHFAADVAHEIKNPLTSLRSAVETACRLEDPVAQKRLMAIIQEDVGRLTRLISDISDASRLDAELSRAEAEPVDMRRLLEMLIALHEATDGPAPCFTGTLPDGSLTVSGIGDRLMQVFRNLVANAVSFSPADGRILVGVERREGMLRIWIDDQGPGIPPGKEDAIFDRFYTERPESEKFGTHSGLGLSISRQIVEAHGGTIRAENRIDGSGLIIGARFVVSLPMAGG